MAYNAEMRGLANYYRLAWDVKRALNRLYYLWWGSLLRTLAMKHKTTVSKAAKHLRARDGEYVARYTVDGKPYQARVFKLKHLDRSPVPAAGVDAIENLNKWLNRRQRSSSASTPASASFAAPLIARWRSTMSASWRT
jgi:hypothetical protein